MTSMQGSAVAPRGSVAAPLQHISAVPSSDEKGHGEVSPALADINRQTCVVGEAFEPPRDGPHLVERVNHGERDHVLPPLFRLPRLLGIAAPRPRLPLVLHLSAR